MTAEEFNQKFSVGTSVCYHTIIGRSEHIRAVTRSKAWTLPNGEAVVALEGKAGCVALAAISVTPEVERYAEIGRRIESHSIACMCPDCKAFMAQGDLVHAKGMQA